MGGVFNMLTVAKEAVFLRCFEGENCPGLFKEPDVEKSKIYVDKDILETIIKNLLYFAGEDDTMKIQPSQKQYVIGFEPIYNENDEVECYKATILNSFH